MALCGIIGIIQYCKGLSCTIGDFTGLYGCVQDYMGVYRDWICRELYGIILDYLGYDGILKDCKGLYRILGIIRDYTEFYRFYRIMRKCSRL